MVEITAEDLEREVKELFEIKLQAYDDNIKHFRDKDKEVYKKFKKDRVRLQNISQLTLGLIEVYIKGVTKEK